jgi:hypothetical protein
VDLKRKRGGRRKRGRGYKKKYKEEERQINALVRAADFNRVQQGLFLFQLGRLDRI